MEYASNGEIRQEFEVTLIGEPISGQPAASEEGSDVRWTWPAELDSLDIHPTMRRQLDDYTGGRYPNID